MAGFVLRRLAWALVILFAVATITFVLARVVPANPAAFLAGQNASAETVARITAQYGLDRPLPEQYANYMGGLVQGDLGDSFRTRRAVTADLAQFLPATLELLLVAVAVYLALSLALGTIAARARSRIADGGIRLVTMVGTGIPVFWLGLTLQLVFFYHLQLLPLDGRFPIRADMPPSVTGFLLVDTLLALDPAAFLSVLRHLALPVTAIVVSLLAVGVRMTRGAVLEQYRQPYVRTLRGKGIPGLAILRRHVLRNAANPILTVTGIQFGYMISWVILVEVIFNWPGIGLYAFRSFEVFDYAPIIALTLVATVVFAVVNLVTDLLYPVIDPRVQRAGS
jgi:ABC-type dipeptide/oligopeptide/nickel transport system permease component